MAESGPGSVGVRIRSAIEKEPNPRHIFEVELSLYAVVLRDLSRTGIQEQAQTFVLARKVAGVIERFSVVVVGLLVAVVGIRTRIDE